MPKPTYLFFNQALTPVVLLFSFQKCIPKIEAEGCLKEEGTLGTRSEPK